MSRFYTKKADDNQKEILHELWDRGISAVSIHRLGEGLPDILVGYQGRNYIFEIKNSSYAWKLTSDEAAFASAWKGQWDVVDSVETILIIIGAIEQNYG